MWSYFHLFVQNKFCVILLFVVGIIIPIKAQVKKDTLSPKALKKLSMEDLMDITVTSVSKRPERLSEVASAIQVIMGEDMRKYGASNIPEALYLTGNLQVVQKGSHAWGVTARGFNTDLANKMLVLRDGRTLYTPLFSGVFWERQDYLLEDIDRIEVISGPGGTLWGANAVNGVINITTKSAEKTQGLYLEGLAGNELEAQAGIRYGGKVAENVFYRVYGKYATHDGSVFPDSVDAGDSWDMAQGGFRIDTKTTSSKFTLQGDLYKNNADLVEGGTSTVVEGNVLGRWTYTFSDSSKLRIRTYYDHADLDLPTAAFIVNGLELAPAGTFEDKLDTYDLDLQYTFALGERNHLVGGVGYRYTNDQTANAPALGFIPSDLEQNLFSAFIQDEYNVIKNLFLTVGTKVEHNDYTGYEFEPNGRLRYSISDKWMTWAAVSRAVRTPSRVDRDITEGTPPYFQLLVGNPDFRSEILIAEELGVRGNLGSRAITSISFYYNQYDHLRSTVLNPDNIFPLNFDNGLEGEVYGLEASLNYQVKDWWKLYAAYNLTREDIRVKDGEEDFNNAYNETADPGWQFSLRSSFLLPHNVSVSGAFRYVDDLEINDEGMPKKVPSYAELDGQVSWKVNDHFEFSIAGRNLLHEYHVEYGVPGPSRMAIERSVYGKLKCWF